jgi:hypothetical protein
MRAQQHRKAHEVSLVLPATNMSTSRREVLSEGICTLRSAGQLDFACLAATGFMPSASAACLAKDWFMTGSGGRRSCCLECRLCL